MLIKPPTDIPSSQITPRSVYLKRREFLQQAALAGVGAALGAGAFLRSGPAGAAPAGAASAQGPRVAPIGVGEVIPDIQPSPYSTDETPTQYRHIITYNNFYEFGTSKSDPSRYAGDLKTRPWSIVVDGACEAPGEIGIEDILSGFTQEERIYRLRCVEAWMMVIPWVGFPLGDLLARFKPLSSARYVAFDTLYDPEEMPGQRRAILDWPYREGLRMDEAMNPLTILATGLYGELLPNQNGAPLRLVVPWKYGFKSIKSIVRIRFTEDEPPATWKQMQSNEYGFYANVNPEVDHPRWSQKSHRIIGAGILANKEPTLMFNGYADQVASLYSGMDLTRYY